MGARGPKPLPPNVHLLRGNPSKLRLDELGGGAVVPDVEIPSCPKHLLPEARKFWKRLAPELAQLALIAAIDQAALALVCQEWAHLVWHENMLQRDIKLAEQKREAWEANRANADKPYEGGNGFMLPTPNGNWTYNPHWVARNKHALLLDKFLASFGMSPSSRGRVTAGNNTGSSNCQVCGGPEGRLRRALKGAR
jgi:P27 family predicted phage terminase small subunit